MTIPMSVESDLVTGLEAGEELVVATVVRVAGEPPSRVGAKVLLDRDGPRSGTLGCSDFDSAARADVAATVQAGTPRIRAYAHALGSVEVLLEPYLPRPTLVVGSATPVAATILAWARDLGFRTVLVETRSARVQTGTAGADEVVHDLERLDRALHGEVHAVLTDHDSPDVVPLLRMLVAHGPRFVGMMGSRRHTAAHLDALRRQGLSDAETGGIETPVGIDLGGREAPEIALSILASIVARRRGGSGGWLAATADAQARVESPPSTAST